MNIRLIILGVTLFMSSLWGGAYLLSSLPNNHWASFPIFMTSGVVIMAGIATLSFGLVYPAKDDTDDPPL